MHTSAALGTAVYQQNASIWQQTQPFKLTDPAQRIAVSVFRSSAPDGRVFWPPTLNDATIQPNSGDTQTRLGDGATMIYVPSGTFQMGSTEAEIEAAIDLCNEHYNICNRWYYMRGNPQH